MLWLLEHDVYAAGSHPLTRAVAEAGHEHRVWDDDWWRTGEFPAFDGPVLFHGSLANAAQIRELGPWRPGGLCNTEGFHCSRWYPGAASWLVHEAFVVTTVRALIAAPAEVAGGLADSTGQVFVRPDSPLKCFSGRVQAEVGDEPAALAAAIAARLEGPDPVYVLDIVETEAGLRMLEINPFSGADLYACDKRAIVTGVARWAETRASSGG